MTERVLEVRRTRVRGESFWRQRRRGGYGAIGETAFIGEEFSVAHDWRWTRN